MFRHQLARQPQTLAIRRACFQIHLWTGLLLAVYLLVIALTGSVLVYRDELYRYFEPPIDGPVPRGYLFTSWLLDLHDNLLAGDAGRQVNGVGAALLVLLAASGAIVWWPGVARWRRHLRPARGTNWKAFAWRLHSAVGAWTGGFLLMWGVTGTYLAFPEAWAVVFDTLQPYDPATPGERFVDRVEYWLAFLHFGRLGGRGIPGCGDVCNEVTKGIWALVAIAPPTLVVTGTLLWWNRTVRRRRPPPAPRAVS